MTEQPICIRCGQPVDRSKESFRQGSPQGIQHVVCPTSPELAGLPAAAPARHAGTPAERPQYLTLGDAARMLSVSTQTLRRRIRSGELPAKRLKGTAGGGRETILIEQRDVLALLEDYTGPAEGEEDV